MAAYAQFDGVSDDVDMTILDAAAHEPTDPPTPNLDTGSLRERASELISAMEATGADMMAAVDAGDRAAMRAAADALRALTGPEIETLKDAEAEDCYAEAGSAYGWTLSNWDLAASNIRRYADAGEELALEVGLDFAADAMESTADWRRADDAAC